MPCWRAIATIQVLPIRVFGMLERVFESFQPQREKLFSYEVEALRPRVHFLLLWWHSPVHWVCCAFLTGVQGLCCGASSLLRHDLQALEAIFGRFQGCWRLL